MVTCKGTAAVGCGVAALVMLVAVGLQAQSVANNPYHAVHGWEQMPNGWVLGVPSGIFPDPDGQHIWILSRCGENHCANSDQDAIFKFDLDGNVVKSFGAGMFSFPHGFFLDHEGYLWVTEGAPKGDRREVEGLKRGLGHQVFKLDQDGNVVMTLGEAGVSGYGPNHFNGPAGVVVTPEGDIWVSDGHRGGNNRIVKFSKDGEFILEVGGGVAAKSGDPGSSTTRMTSPSTWKAGSSSRIAATTGSRSSTRMGISSRSGLSSADPARSSWTCTGMSTPATGCPMRTGILGGSVVSGSVISRLDG